MALTFNTTTRRALRWLTGSNLVSDIDAGFQALAEDVDAQLLTRSFGKSIVATAETRVNTAYGLMPTPDRVQSIVLPTDGLIAVLYQATWQSSTAGAGRGGVFLGANQIKMAQAGQVANAFEATTNPSTAARDQLLYTLPVGLACDFVDVTNGPYPGDATTGQVIGAGAGARYTGGGGTDEDGGLATRHLGGAPMWIFAAAGTYDVSVQFKATSGSVTAKSRHLWVWSMGF